MNKKQRLFNTQEQEIERLKELNKVLENDNYNKELNLESLCDEIDRLESVIKEKDRLCFDCKKPVKEFAEKLKKRITDDNGTQISTLTVKGIELVLKEFLSNDN